MNISVIHFVSTLGSEVNTIDKCLLPFFHHCSLPYIPSLIPFLFSYLCLVPFPLLSLLHSTCLLSSLTSFLPPYPPPSLPLKSPYLSSFPLLSLLSPIPTSPFRHLLQPDSQETSVPTHSFTRFFVPDSTSSSLRFSNAYSRFKTEAMRISQLMKDSPRTPSEKTADWIEHVLRHGAQHLRGQAYNIPWYQYYLLDVMVFLVTIVTLVTMVIGLTCRCLCRVCCRKGEGKTKKE